MKPLNTKQFVENLISQGYIEREGKGSHRIFVKSGKRYTISFPNDKEISAGVSRNLLKFMQLNNQENKYA